MKILSSFHDNGCRVGRTLGLHLGYLVVRVSLANKDGVGFL